MAREYPITVEVNVIAVDRLNNSVAGNPRYRLNVDSDARWYVISSDSTCAYDVENVTKTLPVRVHLALTPAGRFYDIWRS